MPALQTLLQPQVLTDVISRQAGASSWLLNLFGCQPGGANEQNFGHGRTGAYNIYNNVNDLGQVTAPGAPAAQDNAQIMGRVPFTYPRYHNRVPLPAEDINNIGRIDDPAQRDVAGQKWISQQTMTRAQKLANFRKVQLAGMLQASSFIVPDNEAFTLDFAAGAGVPTLPIESQMPAGNKLQLDMLGDGDIIDVLWSTSTSDIPNQFGLINAAFQQLCGGQLAATIMPWSTWNLIMTNDVVAATAGTSNSPFVSIQREELDPLIGNTMLNTQVARLNFAPWVTNYITDEGFTLGPSGSKSFKKICPEGSIMFIGSQPASGGIAAYIGSEPIAEYDGGPMTNRAGVSSWSTWTADPTAVQLYSLDNCLVLNQVPDCTAFATVV